MLIREEIDNLEHAYLQLHFLLEIMEQIISTRMDSYENSDISCLYSVIMDKRNCFHNCLNDFMKLLLKRT